MILYKANSSTGTIPEANSQSTGTWYTMVIDHGLVLGGLKLTGTVTINLTFFTVFIYYLG